MELGIEQTWDPYVKEKRRGELMAVSRIFYTMGQNPEDVNIRNQLLELIKKNRMAPYYRYAFEKFNLEVDTALCATMSEENQKSIETLSNKIDEARKNKGEDEVIDLILEKGHMYYSMGDKAEALKSYEHSMTLKMSTTLKIEVHMYILDTLVFHMDYEEMKKYIRLTQKLVESGGDWEHRNRLSVYQSVECMMDGQFLRVSELLLPIIATFTAFSVISFNELVLYATIAGLMHSKRSDLSQYLLNSSDVEMALLEMPTVNGLLRSFMDCNYSVFFHRLMELEQVILSDRLIHSQKNSIFHQLRKRAYSQFLDSYKSCTLQSIANSFGVSPEFITKELALFISEGSLHAKIDRVRNVVETYSQNSLSSCYDQILGDGTLLLNRVHQIVKSMNI